VSLTDVAEDVDAFLRELEREDGEVRFERKLIPMGGGRLWLRPAEAARDHPGVRALAHAVRTVTGDEPEIGAFNGGWVDGAELMRDGEPACIVFGPGDFEQAHAADEHVSVREVTEAARVYLHATLELLV
jgi:acetylornithine deacetylase